MAFLDPRAPAGGLGTTGATVPPMAAHDTTGARMPAGEPVAPVLPDYEGGCLSSVVPALLSRGQGSGPGWLAEVVEEATQVVLLVVDGLGWLQLQDRLALAPTLASGTGGPITSVVPTTTATALTSLATGLVPAVHGVLGYRLRFGDDVLNVLGWRSERGDMRMALPVPEIQPTPAFAGERVPAVSKADFAATGFTAAHLGGSELVGWSVPSSLVVEVRRLLGEGHRLVYAYYDGIDKVAHQYGLDAHYDQELRFVDRLVGDLVSELSSGAALVLTADHGQVDVGDAVRLPSAALLGGVDLVSGEGRFRWLHARAGAAADVEAVARAEHGAEAWVMTIEQLIDERWFGGLLAPAFVQRLGDVAIVAREPVAFLDPADTGETCLASRHGSLTEAEMLVPLLAWPAR